MEWELEDIFHRKVDLITKQVVMNNPNWIRRKAVLNTMQVIYDYNQVDLNLTWQVTNSKNSGI